MQTLITELFYRNIKLSQQVENENTDLRSIELLMQRNFKNLAESVNATQLQRLDAYKDCAEVYALLLAEQSFYDGFCMGTKMIAEALTYGIK